MASEYSKLSAKNKYGNDELFDIDGTPLAFYPCYDCGSTIIGHHTPHCELCEDDAIRDLEQIPGTQWWAVPNEDRPPIKFLLETKSMIGDETAPWEAN